MKEKVLFICVHNSARSQMAEAWLKHLAGDRFEVYSAGIEPGVLNPVVVAAMAEVGIDISGNKTKSIAELLAAGHQFDYAITVCDDAQAEVLPDFSRRRQAPALEYSRSARRPGDGGREAHFRAGDSGADPAACFGVVPIRTGLTRMAQSAVKS